MLKTDNQCETSLSIPDATVELGVAMRDAIDNYEETKHAAIGRFLDSLTNGDTPRMALAFAKQILYGTDNE